MPVVIVISYVLLVTLIGAATNSRTHNIIYDKKAAENELVRLACNATLPHSVEWSYRAADNEANKVHIFSNNRLMKNQSRRIYVDSNDRGQFDLVIRRSTTKDSGMYLCAEDEGFGSRFFYNVTISDFKTADEGSSFDISCCTTSSRVEWMFSPDHAEPRKSFTDSGIVNGTYYNLSKKIISKVRGGSKLTVTNATLDDSGHYACSNGNSGSEENGKIFVVVSRLAYIGSNVTLPCPSNSNKVDWKCWTPLNQEWIYTQGEFQNGFKTGGRHKYSRTNSYVILSITNVTEQDTCVYICEDDERDVQYSMGLRALRDSEDHNNYSSWITADGSLTAYPTREPSDTITPYEGLNVIVISLAITATLLVTVLCAVAIAYRRRRRRRQYNSANQATDEANKLCVPISQPQPRKRNKAEPSTADVDNKFLLIPFEVMAAVLVAALGSPQWANDCDKDVDKAHKVAFKSLSLVCKDWVSHIADDFIKKQLRKRCYATVHWKLSYLLRTNRSNLKLVDLIETESEFLDELVPHEVINLSESITLRTDRDRLSDILRNCASQSEKKCQKIMAALVLSGQQHVVNYVTSLGKTGADELPLDKATRKTLRRGHAHLVRGMSNSTVDELERRGIISERQKKFVEMEPSIECRNGKLLLIISRKSSAQYKLFESCLAELQPEILKMLDNA